VKILSERAIADGLAWVKVRDTEGREGWVAESFLVSDQ
jgi:SH3-like domain-containing protein